jgi:DNA-binding response OmpR family regulator
MSDRIAEKGRKVLIIDDSDVQLYFEERALVRAGFEVRTANSLDGFEEIFRSWQPDIVLTDVQMPDIRGDELCKVLKQRMGVAQTPVVLISSLPHAELAILARRCQADGFLSKQAGLERLAEELETLWSSILW